MLRLLVIVLTFTTLTAHAQVREVARQGAWSFHEGVTDPIYSNPLPHVLMLTAIVVGVATTAVGLALVVRINEEFGTIEADEILEMEGETKLKSWRDNID